MSASERKDWDEYEAPNDEIRVCLSIAGGLIDELVEEFHPNGSQCMGDLEFCLKDAITKWRECLEDARGEEEIPQNPYCDRKDVSS